MPKPVHPFTYHQARWSKALENLSSAHETAKNAAVGHIHQKVAAAADASPGMDSQHVGAFWHRDQPHIAIQQGTPTAELEYGTLTNAPRATIRNAAHRAGKDAVRIYRNTVWDGLDL